MKERMYATMLFATMAGLLLGFSIILMLDSYTGKKRKRIFASIIALTFVLVLQNYFSYYLTHNVKAVVWRTLVSVIGYSIRPAIITLFAVLFLPEKKHTIAWVLVGVNAVMHTTAFYSGIVFQIDQIRNIYRGGPLAYLCLAVSLVLIAYLAVLGFMSYKEKRYSTQEALFHAFWLTVVIVGIVADMLWGYDSIWISNVTISVVITELCCYIWLHQRFVADYESAVLAEQRFQMMLSQMQPHFIYNTLSAIAEIDGVPEKAEKAIVDFSMYLRENLDVSIITELVPFEKEIGHVKKYIDLEVLRFGNRIKAVFNLECQDFLIPALTVQMLVENAVKHGITKRYEGGTIVVSSKKEKDGVVVTVRDDGVGFDAEKEFSSKHIGINNIRKRLEYAAGGTLKIESEIGKGTIATVFLPGGKKEKK